MQVEVVVDIKVMSLLKDITVVNHGCAVGGQHIHLTLEVDNIDRYTADMGSVLIIGGGKRFSLLPGMLIGYSEALEVK